MSPLNKSLENKASIVFNLCFTSNTILLCSFPFFNSYRYRTNFSSYGRTYNTN